MVDSKEQVEAAVLWPVIVAAPTFEKFAAGSVKTMKELIRRAVEVVNAMLKTLVVCTPTFVVSAAVAGPKEVTAAVLPIAGRTPVVVDAASSIHTVVGSVNRESTRRLSGTNRPGRDGQNKIIIASRKIGTSQSAGEGVGHCCRA